VRVLHLLAGLRAELVQEVLPGVAERGQCLGLPAALVQRDHELRAQPFAQRELLDQPGQVRDERGVLAASQLDLDPLLPRGGMQIGQPGAGRVEDRPGQPGQRVAAPQRQAGTQGVGGLAEPAGRALVGGPGDRGLELVDVDGAVGDPQHVAAAGQR
jgi:hypothetical protein